MGRMIDADALTDYVTMLYEYDLCHTDADDYTEGRASAEHWILEKIRELPTIDAIPVEWMKEKTRHPDNHTQASAKWMLGCWKREQEENNEHV